MPIRKVFVKGLPILIILLTSLSLYAQDYYTTTSDLNLRSGAGNTHPVIIVLEKGDTVNLLEETSEHWVKVQRQGEIGFTSKEHLEKIEVAKNESKADEEVDRETESDEEVLTIFFSFLVIFIIGMLLKKKGETFRYKSIAIILSFLFGIFGFQKFYLGERNRGILSVLFCWTYIPMLIGGVDCIRLLLMREAKFNSLYNFGKSPEVNLSTKNTPLKPKTKATTLIKPKTHSYQAKRNYVDDSIIDVNSENLNLRIEEDTKSETLYKEPPYWRHTYIYSFDEIKSATKPQKEYYLYFKGKVLEGKYVDLKGNTNYAFVLYFDFINEYKNHKNIKLLDQLFNLLSEISPKTTTYSSSYIEEELRRIGEEYSIDNLTKLKGRIRPEKNKTPKKVKELEKQNISLKYTYTPYDPDEHKLGAKYKNKLSLSKREVALLNKFHNPSNAFTSIEGCCIAVIRIYLAVFKTLGTRLKKNKTKIDLELEKIFEEVCKIEKLKFSRYNAKYEKAWALSVFKEKFYTVFFKTIENLVREEYGNKRKLSFKKYHPYSKSEGFINEAIGDEIELLIVEKMNDLIAPNLETLVVLNKQNVNRWKIQLESLKNDFKKGVDEDFMAAIDRLEETNKENPNIENIFLEASKFISKYNKIAALNCYAKYVYYDLKSKKVNDKKLTKTTQKLLFKTKEQADSFEEIITNLKQTRSLQTALEEIPKIYILKRKKIKLDHSEIQSIEEKHEGTVELLNEYLVDEEKKATVQVEDKLEEVLEKETLFSRDTTSIFVTEINMGQTEEELIKMIVNNSYQLEQSVVEEYALKNGMFKNQLIDRINEACEVCLEGEALIEEEDENYIIEESYYIEIAK